MGGWCKASQVSVPCGWVAANTQKECMWWECTKRWNGVKQGCKTKLREGWGAKANLLHHPRRHWVPAHTTFPHGCLKNRLAHFFDHFRSLWHLRLKKELPAEKRCLNNLFSAEYFILAQQNFCTTDFLFAKKHVNLLRKDTAHVKKKEKTWGYSVPAHTMFPHRCLRTRP